MISKVYPTFFAIVAAFIFLGCTSTPKDRYLLSFYSVSGDLTKETLRAELDRQEVALRHHQGRLAVAPIQNTGPIESAALPDYTSALPGNYLIVQTFPSKVHLDGFLEEQDRADTSAHTNLRIDAAVTAKLFKPMPMMQDYPVIGSIPHRESPAFILLNGISMNSMANPMTGIRMLRYMNANLPKLEAQGTTLLGTFEVLDVVRGAFDFDMLFLTEWESPAAFDAVHQDPEFIDIARKTRNRAFRRFADDHGEIRFDLALDLDLD